MLSSSFSVPKDPRKGTAMSQYTKKKCDRCRPTNSLTHTHTHTHTHTPTPTPTHAHTQALSLSFSLSLSLSPSLSLSLSLVRTHIQDARACARAHTHTTQHHITQFNAEHEHILSSESWQKVLEIRTQKHLPHKEKGKRGDRSLYKNTESVRGKGEARIVKKGEILVPNCIISHHLQHSRSSSH